MSNSYFSFKQFTIFQDKCAMKVGIDGVLLGVWTPIEEAKTILDVGTGTGLIALMLAQRSQAEITGIDIEPNAVQQATENVRNSPWSNQITIQENSLQDFSTSSNQRFDLIVSNPPYFVDSLKAPSKDRNAARHTDTLTHEELIVSAKKLLTETGRICIILPVNEGLQCMEFAGELGLYCTRSVQVFPKPAINSKRLLLEFSLIPSAITESELVIESEIRHHYSPEFTELAKDFYLKL